VIMSSPSQNGVDHDGQLMIGARGGGAGRG
jgi:hypothetical protein